MMFRRNILLSFLTLLLFISPIHCSNHENDSVISWTKIATVQKYPLIELIETYRGEKLYDYKTTEAERLPYLIGIEAGQITHNDKVLTNQAGKFVMDGAGNIFFDTKEDVLLHHSSFFAGGPVAAAGNYQTDGDGRLIWMDNYSGHYRPAKRNLLSTFSELNSRGADMSAVTIRKGFEFQVAMAKQIDHLSDQHKVLFLGASIKHDPLIWSPDYGVSEKQFNELIVSGSEAFVYQQAAIDMPGSELASQEFREFLKVQNALFVETNGTAMGLPARIFHIVAPMETPCNYFAEFIPRS